MRETELSSFQLLLASPTYGPADPRCGVELRGAVMYAANHGVTWVGDISTDRMPFSTARNTAAQGLLESTEANGLMWVDSDMRQKPDDMARVLLAARNLGADFVTGVYHQRRPPYCATIFRWKDHLKKWLAIAEYPRNSYEKVDACGFGFVYTSKRLIEKLADAKGFESWFPDEQSTGGYGEDMAFCYQAMQVGVQLYAHTGVVLGHLGEPEIVHPDTHPAMPLTVMLPGRGKQWGRE